MLGQLQLDESATKMLHVLLTWDHPNCVMRHELQPPCMLCVASNAHKLYQPYLHLQQLPLDCQGDVLPT